MQCKHILKDYIERLNCSPQGAGAEFSIRIKGTQLAAGGKSVFARVADGREQLERLREGVRKELTKRDLTNGGFGHKAFEPHVTLLKSSLKYKDKARSF